MALPVRADWACHASPPIRLSRVELINIYSGQPVLINGSWLIAVMLPANSTETQIAFGSLGLSPQAAERLAKSNGLVDRNIRLAITPTDMALKLRENTPSVGYGLVILGEGLEKCN